MATKVGGFTKSGVVQCMKLVEESSIEMFSGTVDSNIITLNNGMKITFTYGPSDTPAGYTQTGSYLSFKDSNYGTPFLRLDINNTSTNKTVVASITNEEAWNSSEDLNIGLISGSIGAAVPTFPCKWVIEYKGQTDTYSISSRGPIITNAVGGNTLLKVKDRTPTVRMGKDGTLKCKELIEEEVVDNIDSFAPLQTSSSGSHTFILKNGTYIDLYENDTLVNVTTQGGIDCFQSGTPVLSISFSPNQIGHTSSNSQTEWDYNGPVSIVRVNVHFSNPTNYTNINKCVITSNNKTATFTGRVSTGGVFLGNLSDTSDSWDLSYNERFKIPTVRIFKDGTIKCAEVEEATKTSQLSTFVGKLSDSNRLITCTNGLKVYLLTSKNNSFLTNSYTYLKFQKNLDTSSFMNTLQLEVVYSAVTGLSLDTKAVTLLSDSQWLNDPDYIISRIRVEAAGINVDYVGGNAPNYSIKIVESNGEEHLYESIFTQGAASLDFNVASGSTPFVLSNAYRVKYSWPGSTIVKATNTFITSDNKNFLTSTGDQFMVK